ncbi:MAG: hypothetical protein KBF89_08435 [Acidimicrobiia bacterium]|nr:hypothetical protein [Acidimicrobiia bacterium]
MALTLFPRCRPILSVSEKRNCSTGKNQIAIAAESIVKRNINDAIKLILHGPNVSSSGLLNDLMMTGKKTIAFIPATISKLTRASLKMSQQMKPTAIPTSPILSE